MVSLQIWLSLGILSICAVLLIPYQQLFVCCEVLLWKDFVPFCILRTCCSSSRIAPHVSAFSLSFLFHALFFLKGTRSCFSLPWIWDPLICSVAWCFWPCWWSSYSELIHLWQAAWACIRIPHASCVASIWGLWLLFPPFSSCRMGNTVEMTGCFSLMSIKTQNPLTT